MEKPRVLRHNPTQKRSRNRVEEILRAAEHIFSERGYEQSTTNAIADQAGIPIGSLYQYFKNKKAILDALSDTYSSGLKELFASQFAKQLETHTLYEISDDMLEELARFYATHPAFQVVLYGASRTSDLDAASDELRHHIVMFIYNALMKNNQATSEKNARLTASILVTIARAILPAAISSNGEINTIILDELKKVIKAYLRPAASHA